MPWLQEADPAIEFKARAVTLLVAGVRRSIRLKSVSRFGQADDGERDLRRIENSAERDAVFLDALAP